MTSLLIKRKPNTLIMQVDEAILKEISEQLLCGSQVYLHRETGEIVTIHDTDLFLDEEDPWEGERRKVNAAPGKYISFEIMDSRKSYQLMQDFINQLSDSQMADRLALAIEKK